MPRLALVALTVALFAAPRGAHAADPTGYRWFGCEVGLTLGGVGLALTIPPVIEATRGDSSRPDSSGAPVFAVMGLTALAFGLCPAGLFTADAIAASNEADPEIGYGLAGSGLSALGGAMLGYGLGQAFDVSPSNRKIAAGVGGLVGAVGGYLVAGRVGTEPVTNDSIQAPLFAYAALFILTGLITNVAVAISREDDASPSPALLIAPAVAGLTGFYLAGALTR